MFSRLAMTAAATLAAVLATAGPAAASVRYDPARRTGYADAADVRTAFGWTDATLAARADGLRFSHDFWTRDTYTVRCGRAAFAVQHEAEFGSYDLTVTPDRRSRRDAPAGYGQKPRVAGFTISGAQAGISGTSVAPAVGQPCPQRSGARITRADLVSTKTGWALSVSSGTVSRVLRTH